MNRPLNRLPLFARITGRCAKNFPPAIAEKFPDALAHHRLRREIIATQLANSMINRGGPTLVVRISDQTGATPARIAAAFAAVRNSYDLIGLNTEIEGLDNLISGKLQLDLFAAVQDLLLDRIVWFLRNVDLGQGLAAVIEHYQAGVVTVAGVLDGRISVFDTRSDGFIHNTVLNENANEGQERGGRSASAGRVETATR